MQRTFLLVIVLVLTACGSTAPANPAPPPPPVAVAEVLLRDVEDTAVVTGRIAAVHQVEIRARVGGFIDRVAFTEGSLVAAGAPLFIIDARPYQAALAHAEASHSAAAATLALATGNLQRARDALTHNAQSVSAEELERRISAERSAIAAVAGAEASVVTAKLNVGYTTITAPVAGRIGRALVTQGNLVDAGIPVLTTLVSVDPMQVVCDLDQRQFATVRALSQGAALPVHVAITGEEGFPHPASLDFFDNHVDPATATVRIRATLANPDGRLLPGAFARVSLPVSAKTPQVLIDERAVGSDQSFRFVLALNADGSVAPRPVTLGARHGRLRVVTQGLAAGDVVVLDLAFPRVLPGKVVDAQRVAMDPDERAAVEAAAAAAAPEAKAQP